MVINPHNDCTWTFQDGKLSINLTTDEGRSFLFKTHYDIEDLYVKPEVNASFTIRDAELLTDYQEGIGRIIGSEGGALDLGLNAVACARFTRPAVATSRYFLEAVGAKYQYNRGDVVSVYTKNGKCGDCVVLDQFDSDGLTRLMLLNRELVLDEEQNRGYSLGQMIRVSPEKVSSFRAINRFNDHSRYA